MKKEGEVVDEPQERNLREAFPSLRQATRCSSPEGTDPTIQDASTSGYRE